MTTPPHSPQWEIARAARAARRDDACDRVAASLTLLSMDRDTALWIARAVTPALAAWLTEHGEPNAAGRIMEWDS